jgi:iron uptake system component EfeO
MTRSTWRTLGAVAAAAVVLSACTDNQSDSDAIAVSATEDQCDVDVAEVGSGNTSFAITNDGTGVTEFYILGSDGLRVVAEQENIAPGTTSDLTVALQPGDYFTACKPSLRGPNVGEAAFTVTGDQVEVSADDEELFDEAVASYVDFVQNEVAELVPNVEEFAQAYMDGDDETARDLYADVRVNYERIEPVAEALGVLDPRIDYREVDYLAEADELAADDPTFTEWLGFHRIEKDLWQPEPGDLNADGTDALAGWEPSTDEERQTIGQALIDDVQALYDRVNADDFIETQQINISTVSNGASGLLEEVAVGKVTGEENWWSHYDLWDFQANVQGSRIAFDLVAPIAERSGDEGTALVAEINEEFDALQAMLDEYGNLEDGYVLYDQVTAAEQADLTSQIDALREPLSRLTGTVLGIE